MTDQHGDKRLSQAAAPVENGPGSLLTCAIFKSGQHAVAVACCW